ncbi:MAG: ATP-grasp domain-containing protein, partial [Candidatus Puniceispirillaceae bacterium]
KISSRLIFSSVGITVPPLLTLQEDTHVQPADYTGDYVIKPRNDGSSVGVVIVKDGMPAPQRSKWAANTQLIAEEYITGRELTVSVLDGRALCVTEIHVPGQFYDFDAKYKVGGSQHTVPADVPEEVTELSCGWAERAFTILGCRGVARADFIWDEDEDQLYMLEINTQPGMTATSLTPEQAAFCGISGEELVNHLLEIAQCDE